MVTPWGYWEHTSKPGLSHGGENVQHVCLECPTLYKLVQKLNSPTSWCFSMVLLGAVATRAYCEMWASVQGGGSWVKCGPKTRIGQLAFPRQKALQTRTLSDQLDTPQTPCLWRMKYDWPWLLSGSGLLLCEHSLSWAWRHCSFCRKSILKDQPGQWVGCVASFFRASCVLSCTWRTNNRSHWKGSLTRNESLCLRFLHRTMPTVPPDLASPCWASYPPTSNLFSGTLLVLLITEPLRKGTSSQSAHALGSLESVTQKVSGRGKHTCPAPNSQCNYRPSHLPTLSCLLHPPYVIMFHYLTPFPSDAHPASMNTLHLLAHQ